MFQKIFMIPKEIDKTTAEYTTYKVIFYFSALLLFLLPYMIVVDFYNKNSYQSMIIEFIGFFAFFSYIYHCIKIIIFKKLLCILLLFLL